MHPLIAKTFGGLSKPYYFRQFVFGLIFPAIFFFASNHSEHSTSLASIFYVTVCTFLYPYSRFVYESVMGFIVGENVFFVNAVLMLLVKAITMAICWVFAIFIAPVGLAYLYYYHSKNS